MSDASAPQPPQSGTHADEDLGTAVVREQATMLYRHGPVTLSSAGLTALAFAILLWPVTDTRALLVWFAGGALVLGSRTAMLIFWHLHHQRDDYDPHWWRRVWLAGILASGLIWAAAIVWLFPDPPLYQVIVALLMIGLCAGAGALYAAVRGAYLLFALPIASPLIIQCLRTGDPIMWIIGGLIALFLLGAATSSLMTAQLIERLGELKRTNAELSWRASHDPLVELPNQREFRRRLTRAAEAAEAHNEHFAVLYIDLDGFKAVNDRYGHAAGDAMLRRIGRVLGSRVRATDTAARLGGDEFGVLLSPCPREHAERIAHSICEAIAELDAQLGSRPLGLSASIGVAYSHEAESSPAGLMRAADAACYEAKGAGKNRVVVFEADAMQSPSGRFAILRSIDLPLDSGRFQATTAPPPDSKTGDG